MKKSAIIVISIIIVIGGIIYGLWRGGHLEQIIPGVGVDTYEYKSEELKKMSEEAGINLEKGMVEEQKDYSNQKEERIRNERDIIYSGKIIENIDNSKEWIIRVMIPKGEEEKKYGIWESIGENVFISELSSRSYEEWEYVSKGDRELKGKYIIGEIGEGNTVQDIQYTIER
jgi:hypothetical protein